jgi:hypothetical protein
MKRTTCDRCGENHDLLMPVPDINPSGICPQCASIESIRNQAFLHLTQGQEEFITKWFNFWSAAGLRKKIFSTKALICSWQMLLEKR